MARRTRARRTRTRKARGAARATTRGLSMRRKYRKSVKRSACRGKGPAVCRSMSNCKSAAGKKRSYCRKSRNSRKR